MYFQMPIALVELLAIAVRLIHGPPGAYSMRGQKCALLASFFSGASRLFLRSGGPLNI
jgi:hypothetical protein